MLIIRLVVFLLKLFNKLLCWMYDMFCEGLYIAVVGSIEWYERNCLKLAASTYLADILMATGMATGFVPRLILGH